MTCNAILDEWLDYMNVDVIFTPVQNDLDVLLPICSAHSKIKHAFAGYSEPSEIERLAQYRRPFAERGIDVGTRVRATPPHYGRAGLVKARSAERFRDTASAAGFAVDISTELQDAFTGDEWFHFLGSCRFTLVARGGASACDPRGEIGRAVAEFVKASPQATFEEIEAACFPGRDRYDFTAVTPRLFEAAALHTGLILLEGDYVAGLVPYKHYIPLKADFSNLREVFALMRDDAGAEAMIAAAYQHLVQSGLFSYRRFVDDVFDEIVAASPEPRHASAADFTQLQRHYQRLAPYQRLAMESPPNWLHIAPQACNRAEILGQRESILALIEARRRGSDARSVMAAMIEAGGRLDPTVAALATEAIAGLADDDGSNLDALAALVNAPPQQLSGLDYGRHSRSCEYIYDPLPEPSNPRNSSVDPVDPEGCADRTGLPAHALGDPLIEPRPYSGSQAARLGADRWAALRGLLPGLRDDPRARIALAERAVPAGKDGGSCEGMLCAAFLLAPAAVNTVQSNGYFCQLLRQLPELPFDHDFWISLTAFATIASPNTAARFDEFLDQRGVLIPEALAKWPLAARTNFLTYCVRHQRLTPALAIVHQASANWSPADNGADAWAFRLTALTVLENAKAYDQLSAHIKAYHELLEGRRIDPAVRANIKVQIELLMAASLRARALDQLALSHYQQAISLIEACPSPRLSSGVLAGLLLTVGKFHEAQRHFAKAQACYERSVVAAESATGKHDLLAALGGLALLSVRQGRHAEAVALYRRRVALIESDPKLGESAKIFANNQLAAALVATGDKSSGWQLFDQTVAAISRGRPPNQALMAATLLARIDAGLAELSDDTLWQDVRALTESTALSIMHCRSLLRLAERAIDADRTKLAADIAAAVSDRSLDVAASNPAQAAPLFLNLACAVQRLGGDPRTAFDLLHHCVRTMAEFAGSTDDRLRLQRQLIDVRLALFEHRLAEAPEADLLDDTKQLLENIGEFLPRQIWVCLSIAQRAFDSASASVASSIIAAVAAVAGDFVQQHPMEARALFRHLAQLTMRKLELMTADASLNSRISYRAAIYAVHYCSIFTERGELFSRESASALAALALAIVAARSSGSCVDWISGQSRPAIGRAPGARRRGRCCRRRSLADRNGDDRFDPHARNPQAPCCSPPCAVRCRFGNVERGSARLCQSRRFSWRTGGGRSKAKTRRCLCAVVDCHLPQR